MITTPAAIPNFMYVTGGDSSNTHEVASLNICQIMSYLTEVTEITSVCSDHGTAY